jgi:hypothetical protein
MSALRVKLAQTQALLLLPRLFSRDLNRDWRNINLESRRLRKKRILGRLGE